MLAACLTSQEVCSLVAFTFRTSIGTDRNSFTHLKYCCELLCMESIHFMANYQPRAQRVVRLGSVRSVGKIKCVYVTSSGGSQRTRASQERKTDIGRVVRLESEVTFTPSRYLVGGSFLCCNRNRQAVIPGNSL